MPPFDLTPAEAMVLLDPELKQGRNPFKVSLMWLLAQQHLKAQEVKRGWFSRRTTRLFEGPRAGAPLPHDLQVVMDTVRDAGTGLMDDIVKAARRRFGPNLLGFQNDHIRPGLIARGLITSRPKKMLMLFGQRRYRWEQTPAGKALATHIKAKFEDARRIPGFLDKSPAQAAALAASLGGLILLLPELRPYLDDIATAMREHKWTDTGGGGDTGSFYVGSGNGGSTGSDRPSKADQRTLDDGETLQWDFDLDGFDLGSLDQLDAGLASLDASFDASADSGGGDGGGGDGGGGGGE